MAPTFFNFHGELTNLLLLDVCAHYTGRYCRLQCNSNKDYGHRTTRGSVENSRQDFCMKIWREAHLALFDLTPVAGSAYSHPRLGCFSGYRSRRRISLSTFFLTWHFVAIPMLSSAMFVLLERMRQFRNCLFCNAHKTRLLTWRQNPGLTGSSGALSESDACEVARRLESTVLSRIVHRLNFRCAPFPPGQPQQILCGQVLLLLAKVSR